LVLDGNISPERDEWMRETPMLVTMSFVIDLVIGGNSTRQGLM
jgi:hypothetical protein